MSKQQKELSMLDKLKGYKTFLFFFAVSMLGIVTMIDADKIQSVLLPLVCQITTVTDATAPCVTKVVAITGAIMTALGVAGKVLRFITTSSIFSPSDGSEKGAAFLLPLIFVALGGLAINGYNAEKAGHPILSAKDFKKAAVASVHNATPDYSRLNP